jgi:hypothetical protein
MEVLPRWAKYTGIGTDMTPIHFDAELRQIKSMVDKSFNIVLNIPEYNIEQVQELMTMLNNMVAVAMINVDKENRGKYE